MEHSACVFKLSVGHAFGSFGWKPQSKTFCGKLGHTVLPSAFCQQLFLLPITSLPLQCFFDVCAAILIPWGCCCIGASSHVYVPPVYILRCQLLGWRCNQDIYFLTINFSRVFVFRNNPLLVGCSAHTSSRSVSCLLIPLMSLVSATKLSMSHPAYLPVSW